MSERRHLTLADHARMASTRGLPGISADMTNQRSMHVSPNPTRDQRARLNLAVLALEQDDPRQWLGEMLDVLGLR